MPTDPSTTEPSPQPSATGGAAIAADVGGTFTDVVVTSSDGTSRTTKVPTTPDDPTEAIVDGVRRLLVESSIPPGDVTRFVHGTTLATNVILERRGTPVAFVTTAGFGSMLELGRQARIQEERHDLWWQPAPSLVPAEHTFELDERLDASGDVVRPLREEQVDAVATAIGRTAAQAVAICLIHSYVNPDHERRVATRLRQLLPSHTVVASCEILPQIREYDRAVATVMSAMVTPVMSDYLRRLKALLHALGVDAPIHVMSSSGDVMSAELAARRAIATVESGPAAGVIAARQVGATMGRRDLLSLDMGGTTAKAAIIRDGKVTVSQSFNLGGSASAAGRLGGGGVTIAVPAIDLAEVGAGGGSIAWVDTGGAMRLGPRSAGAEPGPACYGLGGTEPTVTDANVVLGYLDPSSLGASARPLDGALAYKAIEEVLAGPLKVDVLDAATAIYELANATMASALRMVTVQRGIDPRRFALVVSGGAGPLHVCRLAELVGIRTVVVPASAGVGSAIGLLESELGFERAETALCPTLSADPASLTRILRRLAVDAATDLGIDLDAPGTVIAPSADVRMKGQIHEVTLPLADGSLTMTALHDLDRRFRDHQQETFGIVGDGDTELVALRSRVTMPAAGRNQRSPATQAADHRSPAGARSSPLVRSIRLRDGERHAPVVRHDQLSAGEHVVGPTLIVADDCTTLVPPGWSAMVDEHARLIIEQADG